MQKLLKISAVFFLLIFLIPSQIFCQIETDKKDILSASNRLKFADYLFCDSDYLRAADEYRSYLTLAQNDTARFKLAYSLSRTGNYSEAIDNFKGLFFNSSLSDQAKLESIKAYFFKKDFPGLMRNASGSQFYSSKYKNVYQKLIGFSYLLNDNFIPDSADFFKLFDRDSRDKLLNFYDKRRHPNYKNELTAGLLSALLPGLGKVYVEEYGDGITAFLLTGLFTFLAVDNFNADHNARAWIFSGLAFYFYAGNIYGSVSAAQIYNAGIRFNLDSGLSVYLNENSYFMPKYNFLCK